MPSATSLRSGEQFLLVGRAAAQFLSEAHTLSTMRRTTVTHTPCATQSRCPNDTGSDGPERATPLWRPPTHPHTALRPSRLAPSLAVLLQAELTHTPCARQSRCLTNAASAGPAHATAWFVTTAAPRPNEPPPPSPPPSPATSSARSPHTPRHAMPVVLSDALSSGMKIPACPWCLEAVGVPQARRETVLDFHLIFLVKVAAVACAPVLLPKSPPPPCHMVSAASSVANSPRAKIPHGGWRASSGCGG